MRWRRAAAAGVAAAAVAAPLWGPPLLRPMRFFAVRRVELRGSRYLEADVVVQGLGLGERASVFDDLGEMESRLVQMPGISGGSVRRRLPATLVVTVVEREPVALAAGPQALVAVDAEGRPLPYDLDGALVDAPVVRRADPPLLEALALIRTGDLGLYAGIAAAWTRADEVVLDLGEGRARLGLPVEPPVVRQLAAVWRDVAARGVAWGELDARFRGWVVVRRERPVDRGAGAARPAA